MERKHSTYFTALLEAARLTPKHVCDHSDGTTSVMLTPVLEQGGLFITGTTDELAKFVNDLAGVVRELTEREMAVTT